MVLRSLINFEYTMHRSLSVTVALGLIMICVAGCGVKSDFITLEESILDAVLDQPGTFAVAVHDLQSGEKILINAKEEFHAASTMKTPVMIEVYNQAAQGLFSLDDSLEVKNEFYSIVDSSLYSLDTASDSEKELYTLIGQKKKISDLVYDMIIVSSNLATNLVIDLVDARKVTETMRTLGAKDIEVLRGVEDIKAFEAGMSNSTSAEDLMIIYTTLAQAEVVSPQASQAMIDILFDQKFNEIIPDQLPKEVKVAHKTGAITGVHHDSGIVFLPDGRKYVLILLSKELPDFAAGTKFLSDISKMIFDHFE